ncbi:integrase core domain-containing protein [Streptomyces sp. NPDC002911]
MAQVPLSKVELYAAIRYDARVEGLSSRALSAKYGVGRRTVAMALESVWPAPRKQNPPPISRLDPFKATIDQIPRDDLDAPRKQRHTVKRVFDRLIDGHDNALAESFWQGLKRETMHERLFSTVCQARLEIFQWLTYYNAARRRHSALNLSANGVRTAASASS